MALTLTVNAVVSWLGCSMVMQMDFAFAHAYNHFFPGFYDAAKYKTWQQVSAGDYRRFITVSELYDGENFFTVRNGVRMATPLLLALAVVELSDVAFAVDSIPAVCSLFTFLLLCCTSHIFSVLWSVPMLRKLSIFPKHISCA